MATVLPERLEDLEGLLLRRWALDDAAALGRAVADSTDHLRPWMAWIDEELVPVKRLRGRIAEWERDCVAWPRARRGC